MHYPIVARIAGLALALLVTTSCAGYRLGSIKPVEFENISSIAVPTFRNDTLEPRIATLVTGSLVKELQNDGTYTVDTLDNADAILRGTIMEIERIQLRSARFNTLRSRELRVRMRVNYELEEAGTGLVLDRGTVYGDTNIFLDPNFQLTERQAIDDISQEVAAELVGRIAEGWPGMTGSGAGLTEDERRERRQEFR